MDKGFNRQRFEGKEVSTDKGFNENSQNGRWFDLTVQTLIMKGGQSI